MLLAVLSLAGSSPGGSAAAGKEIPNKSEATGGVPDPLVAYTEEQNIEAHLNMFSAEALELAVKDMAKQKHAREDSNL